MKKIVLTAAMVAALTAIATQAHAFNYQVKSGDTLYSIAKENGTSVAQLKQLNKILGNHVLPGEKIKIASDDYYRVNEGDSIQSIAKQFNVSTFNIRYWNKLSSNELRIGKQLIVSETAYRYLKAHKRHASDVTPALSPTTAKLVKDIHEAERLLNHETTDQSTTDMATNEVYEKDEITNNLSHEIDANDSHDLHMYNLNDNSEHETKYPTNEDSNQVADIAHQIAAGKSYVFGANSDSAVDCSAFAQQVFSAMGKSIPRTTYEQMAAGTRVKTPQAGDLVFFNNGSHVGVYIGNGRMVDALNPKEGVGERAVSYISGSITGYYRY